MKEPAPILAWLLWGAGLLLSLYLLIGSVRHIYRQLAHYEAPVKALWYVQAVAALLGLCLLVWLFLSLRRGGITATTWTGLAAVSILQIAVAIWHFLTFFGSFGGKPFN